MPIRTAPRPLFAELPRPETHLPSAPWLTPEPELLATGARTARGHLGPCSVCGWPIMPGDRLADLADGSGLAHVAGCIGRSAEHP